MYISEPKEIFVKDTKSMFWEELVNEKNSKVLYENLFGSLRELWWSMGRLLKIMQPFSLLLISLSTYIICI